MPYTVCRDLQRELTLLVLSRYPLIAVETVDETKAEALVSQVASDLGMPFLQWNSSSGLIRKGVGGLDGTRDPDEALDRVLGFHDEVLVLFEDIHPYFDRPEVIRRLREVATAFGRSKSAVLVCGSTVNLPTELVLHAASLEIALPSQKELEHLVRTTAKELSASARLQVKLEGDDWSEMARALQGLHAQEARRMLYQAALRDRSLDLGDVPELLEAKKKRVREGGLLEWIEPLDGLGELGGLPNLKRWVERRSLAFSEDAVRFGLEPPRGVLMVGVPGTGKSLACRALAGEWKQPLLRLDPGRLYDKFIGESEANLRRVFSTCAAMAPAVLWVDEIEKALAAGGGTADDGLSQRILGAVLTWMQEKTAPVFLVATSNDVTRLPVELLRRGRFDEIFFVDLPEEVDRARIFSIHLTTRGRDPADFDLEELAARTDGFSGAEIESVVVAALYHAFGERTELSPEILYAEIAATRPLSQVRPREIAAIREWGADHAISA